MISKDQVTALQKTVDKLDTGTSAEKYFHDVDIVLVEGGRKDSDLKKLKFYKKECLRKSNAHQKKLCLWFSDWDVDVNKPVYFLDNINDTTHFLDHSVEYRGSCVHLSLEGTPVPIGLFVQKIFENIVLGMVSSLRGVKENPKRITLIIKRNKDENAKL